MLIKLWKFCGFVETMKKISKLKLNKYTKNMYKYKNIYAIHTSCPHVDNFVNIAVYK